MNAGAIVEVSLGILGRISEGISQAIVAAQSKNEDEAFAILEAAIRETGEGLPIMRAKLKANAEAAEKALAEKFPAPAPETHEHAPEAPAVRSPEEDGC